MESKKKILEIVIEKASWYGDQLFITAGLDTRVVGIDMLVMYASFIDHFMCHRGPRVWWWGKSRENFERGGPIKDEVEREAGRGSNTLNAGKKQRDAVKSEKGGEHDERAGVNFGRKRAASRVT